MNLEYTLSNGQKVKFLDDQKTYLGKSGDGRTAWDYTKTGNGFCDDNDGVYTGDRNALQQIPTTRIERSSANPLLWIGNQIGNHNISFSLLRVGIFNTKTLNDWLDYIP